MRTPTRPGKRLIFRPWIRDPKTGEIRYAWQYGKKAFAIWVDDE